MSKKNIIVIVVCLVVIVIGVYFIQDQTFDSTSDDAKAYPFPVSPDVQHTPTPKPVYNIPSTTLPGASTLEPTPPTPTTPEPVTPAPAGTPNPAPKPVTHKVNIEGFAFDESEIIVRKGDTVVWTNKDNASHTVTGNNGGPNSETLAQNKTYSFTFGTVGTFPYHCTPHPYMKGTVTVIE